MVGRVEGKVAIVSGAGSSGPGVGVGKATSLLFAQEGARVVLVDKFEDRALETLRLIKEAGGEAVVVTADITEHASCQRIADEAAAEFGGIDILINNAAIAPTVVGLLATTPDAYQQIMAVNISGAFMLTRAVIPAMIDGGGGAIANITSGSAIRGTGSVPVPAYATSKAAMLGMMTSVACEFGRYGVRINSIMPGSINTPMRNLAGAEAGVDMSTLDLSGINPLGIEGDAWDVAKAALFLCSSEARFITGAHLPVDGGASVRGG